MKRHRRTPEQIEFFMKKLVKVTSITYSKLKEDVIKDDPSDNKYLECAAEGKADYIISGDKHLADLKFFRGIKIVDPALFLKSVHMSGMMEQSDANP
jgi:predicted nucleic acid-binding protein